MTKKYTPPLSLEEPLSEKKAPALQWYPGKALADTRRLSWKANGIYRTLLDTIWMQYQNEDCSIPDDDKFIAAEIGASLDDWLEARKEIMWEHRPLLISHGKRLFNNGLYKEKAKQVERSQEASEAGKVGAQKRWGLSDPLLLSASKKQTRAERLAGARIRGKHTFDEWRQLLDTYGHRCLKCGVPSTERKLVKNRIVPFYKGGSDSIENLQPLCITCNSKKNGNEIDYKKDAHERLATARHPPDVCHNERLANAWQNTGSLSLSLSLNNNTCRVGDESDPPKDDRTREERIFSYWQKVCGHERSAFDPKRRRAVKGILALKDERGKVYTDLDCKDAIDGVKLSAYHQGANENGKVYDDIELIFRDAKHFEDFAALGRKAREAREREEKRKIAEQERFKREKAEMDRQIEEWEAKKAKGPGTSDNEPGGDP